MLTDSYTVLMRTCHFLSLLTDIMFDVVSIDSSKI